MNFTDKDIRPIPKYIQKRILTKDKIVCPEQKGLRFYNYLTSIKNEVVRIIVAVRNKNRKTVLMKQVVVHGIYTNYCLIKDIDYNYLGLYSYRVGWFDEGIHKVRSYYNDDIWYQVETKYFNVFSITVNYDYLNSKKEFKYCMANVAKPSNVVKYLQLYLKYPQMEYLVKFGLTYLATSVTINKKLAKDKHFAKWLIQNKAELQSTCYYIPAIIKAYKNHTDILLENNIHRVLLHLNYIDYKFIKVKMHHDMQNFAIYLINNNISIATYQDYYKACDYLKLDMTLSKNLYPHDFERWHDIRIDEYTTAKIKDNEKQKQIFINKFLSIANKYSPLQKLNGEYVTLIAKTPNDLVNEGKILHHCVGSMNYDQKFVREETLIFFIRLSSNIDIPLVTLEYSLYSHQILQCYGDHNTKPNNKIMDYINKVWLPYANKNIKKLQKEIA